ncbi:MAG: hypothetical protein A2287_02235 [Candidatus Melainabacteria bacterium RIFOXYA12_FULL_32_12]|nr:MAG: hypothetical protein A2287_02235 [Candidatus Melainabacteria bacterium RIFOXYA12_FULL_32_12]
MARISPIQGITYNLSKVDINKVVAPPYDVISDQEQNELYNLSPNNIVKLILGKQSSIDNEDNNRYARSAKSYKEWLHNDILVKAKKPCIYYYIQDYTTSKGNRISRRGFIAKNYLEEYSSNGVLPHEYTMGGPKEDRLKLMKSCKANFSQIFMLYSDPEHEIDKAFDVPDTPFIDVTDKQGIRNIVYIIDNESTINKITELMKDKTLLIADGHHRYETALAYRDYMRSQYPDYKEEDAFNWVMCYYTNLDDENLKVYPTHRIITKDTDPEKLLGKLGEYFDIVVYPFEKSNKDKVKNQFLQELENIFQNNIAFGMYLKNVQKYFLLKLREKGAVNKILEEKQVPDVLKKLDLSVLHKLVISDYLNISEDDQIKQNGVKYIKKESEAFEAVETNSAELVFLMATPKIQDIKDVSQAGYKMPQKSTYFYPKLLSGLVINPL